MKILLAQLNPIIGDIAGNLKKILVAIEEAKKSNCDLMLTPEMALMGYPAEDFLLLPHFVDVAENALPTLIAASKGIGLIVGTIRKNNGIGKPLFNTAAICYDGKLLGFQDKTLLPTYDVFNERRYFEPSTQDLAWKIGPHLVGVTICEDIWQDSQYESNPIQNLKKYPLDCVVNLSASPFHIRKFTHRLEVCKHVATSLKAPFFYCNEVGGNDSLIFDGRSLAMNKEGALTFIAPAFKEDFSSVNTKNNDPISYNADELQDLYDALILGIKDYFSKQGFTKACIGLSGGIDSALVACLAVKALGSENVVGVSMPSRFSSESGIKDAEKLANNLNIKLLSISIEDPFQTYLNLLNPYFENKPVDTTEENLQARVRGMILMALSNKHRWIVLSTGNKSELALGYSTLYGDMCGGLAVISDLTKDLVYDLAKWINQKQCLIPESTLTKPPSAELRLNQKDTDTLPEYSIIDKVLKSYIELNTDPEMIATIHNIPLATVKDLIVRIHANEYKRRQSPIGLRITEKAFSYGRHFPIVQGWIKQ